MGKSQKTKVLQLWKTWSFTGRLLREENTKRREEAEGNTATATVKVQSTILLVVKATSEAVNVVILIRS